MVDDPDIPRVGIVSLLEPDCQLVGLWAMAERWVDAALDLRPDLIIFGIGMPELNAIDKSIKQSQPAQQLRQP